MSLHFARSCFSAVLLDEYTQARQSGETIACFRDAANKVIDYLGIPLFDEVEEKNAIPGKRQPSLRESVNATLDRFVVIDELEGIFADSASSIIYGGSMKYGPFMNVRSGADASDMDMIVFTDDKMLDERNWLGVMETAFIDESDKLSFFARLGLQRALREDDKIDIMSQRFSVADQGYTISAHFMPIDLIDEAYPQDINEVLSKGNNHRYVRDYKERSFERSNVTNFDMSRRRHDIPVYNRAVEGGFVAANPAYSVIEGVYVPGMYQNLVLPTARFAFDQDGIATEKLDTFSKAVARQEEAECLCDEKASVLNTEPRKPIVPVDVSGILKA